jgi:hypothetical protein
MRRLILAFVTLAAACGGSSSSSTPPPPPPPSGPATPVGVVATPGNGSVALTWTAADGATSYEIARTGGSSGPQTNTSAGNSFADTTVQNGVTYTYTITSVNDAGRSAHSDPVTARPFRLLCSANTLISQIVAYNAEDSNQAAPMRSFGSTTGISGITSGGIDIDPAHGELFSANFPNNAVTAHSLTADGNVAPLRSTNNQSAIHVTYDPTGDNLIYVSQETISTFARTAQGPSAIPLRQLTPAILARKAVLTGPSHGDLMFVGTQSSAVMTYQRTDSGSVAPSAEFNTNPSVQAGTIIYDPVADEILMALDNLGGQPGVAAFPSTTSQSQPNASRVLAGDQTGLTNVTALAMDAAHDVLHVADATGQILTFPADFGASANIAPTAVLGGPLTQFGGGIQDLVFDPASGHLVVHAGTRILTFAADAAGNTAPLSALSSIGSGVESPLGMAFDPSNHELLVANGDTRQTLSAFRSPAVNAAATPLRNLEVGAGAPASTGILVDTAHGEMAVSSMNPPRISFFPLGAPAGTAPIRVIEGPATQLTDIRDIALDAAHDAIVVNDGAFIRRYARNFAVGNQAPLSSVANAGFVTFHDPFEILGGISVDDVHGEIFVANNQQMNVFSIAANGSDIPLRTLTVPIAVVGVLVDPHTDELFVIGSNGNDIDVYPRTATGNDPPTRKLNAQLLNPGNRRLAFCN